MRQLDLFNMEKRRLREDLVVFNDLKEIRAQSQDPFLQQKGERQQPQAAAWEIPGRYMEGKKNQHLHAQALERVAQRDLGICILGGVQSLTEYCPKEPGLITVLVLQLGLDDIGTAAGTSGPFQTKLLYKFESTKMEQVGQKPYPPYGGAVFYHTGILGKDQLCSELWFLKELAGFPAPNICSLLLEGSFCLKKCYKDMGLSPSYRVRHINLGD